MSRLDEIKQIHDEANDAYQRYENSYACADQDTCTDNMMKLFYEEHTDWLIEQAELLQKLREAVSENKTFDELVKIIKSS